MEDQLKPYLTEQGIFIPMLNKTLALKNSLHGTQVYYADCYKTPSFKEWLIILYFLEEINELLLKSGGDVLSGLFWTNQNSKDPYFKGYAVCINNNYDSNNLLGFTSTYVAKVRIFID